MSTTVETNTGSWRKTPREDDSDTQREMKAPRYYYRLESESSKASEEDTESICSLQDRETDVVRDTTDTDSKSGLSDQDEYEVHYEEYEVASLSGSDHGFGESNSSSGSEDMMLAAAAAAICDSSLETWITDCEESDNSSLDDMSFGKTDFSTCIQCKSENDNPLYRYCEKCFQDRKKYYPPRPKRNKKSRNSKKKSDRHVKLATLRSCLNGLSQDSGICSSQECPPLDLDQIVVPDEHLTPAVDVCKNKWILLLAYYRRALLRRKTKRGQSAKYIKKWRFESKMEFLKPCQQERGSHSKIQCSQNALGDEDLLNDTEEQQCDYHERMVEADDTDAIPSVRPPALSLEALPSSSKESIPFQTRTEEAARPLRSSSNTSSRSLKRKGQDGGDNLSDALNNFIKFKQSQSSQKAVNNEPVVSAKKRKLLTFFDDVVETILSFPQPEQAEIKRDIFDVVNNKQIELLRRATETVL